MQIVFMTPGSGDNFYCENCLRDKSLVVALRTLGHDATSMPLYLPPLMQDTDPGGAKTPVFFGGLNVYLQQRFKLFRHTPRWVDRLFDPNIPGDMTAKLANDTDIILKSLERLFPVGMAFSYSHSPCSLFLVHVSFSI